MSRRFSPFYVHVNPYPPGVQLGSTNARGFTAYVTPSQKKREVNLQIAFCVPNDSFCRAAGRMYAELSPKIPVGIYHLSEYLGKAHLWMENLDVDNDPGTVKHFTKLYDYVYKNFL